MSNVAAVCCLAVGVAEGGDWSRFRGPNGTGISTAGKPVPVVFGETENLRWKTALPGPGVSSPIVVGDRVFVTCYSGYGVDRGNPGRMEDLKRHLVCVDRKTGKILWDKSVPAELPEDPYSGAGVPVHGYASHTPVSDGEHVYVFFGKSGALAFDLDGNQLWQTNVGKESDPRRWGSSSSPILHKDKLIVTASAESEALVALDTKTGKQLWRAEASGLSNTWGTPTLVPIDAERTDLVIGVPNEIWAFDPETGKLRWYCQAMETDQYNSSVVSADGVVYGIEGRSGGAVAVKAGGKGDVSGSQVVWRERHSGRFSTPIVHNGRIYAASNGIASCIDAKSGERIYQARLEGGSQPARPNEPPADGSRPPFGGGFGGGRGGFGGADYSSPILVGENLYYVRGTGDVHVWKIGDQFEQIAVNKLPAEGEQFLATPAVGDGELFFRSTKHLFCVGSPE